MVQTEEVPAPSPRKVKLLPYPFHDGTPTENTAQREIRLAMPMCPVDGNPELKQRDGTYKPNPNYTGQLNCQIAYQKNDHGVWDVDKCVELGHDPYHFKLRRAVVEEEVDSNGYVTDSRVRYVVETRLNIMPIALGPRTASGRLLALATARGGKTLEEFGYASPCEYRACSAPQRIETRYGNYCSLRHARLIAADRRGMLLTVPSDQYSAQQAVREREDALEALNVSKTG